MKIYDLSYLEQENDLQEFSNVNGGATKIVNLPSASPLVPIRLVPTPVKPRFRFYECEPVYEVDPTNPNRATLVRFDCPQPPEHPPFNPEPTDYICQDCVLY